MRFDTILTGGGLSALVCGIRLQRNGVKTAVVSSGQSSLFFFSGAFGFLSVLPDGSPVERPLDALAALPENHPYSKIGAGNIAGYADGFKDFFASCGVKLNGCGGSNLMRYLAAGGMKRAWASLPELDLFPSDKPLAGKRVLVVRIPGFLDYFPTIICDSLKKEGASVRMSDVTVPEIDALKNSANVVRSISLAKVLEQPEVLSSFIMAVRSAASDDDEIIVLPQVFGLKSEDVMDMIRESFGQKVLFFNTMTPSVPGNRLYVRLKAAYEAAGGVFISGTARGGVIEGDVLRRISVEDQDMEADSFVLATGSFVSRGLVSSYDSVAEPVLGLDVDYLKDRSEWTSADIGDRQSFMGFGVRTDDAFHPSVNGVPVRNLYAAGSILSGTDSLHEGSGAGVAVFTAMRVSDLILGR